MQLNETGQLWSLVNAGGTDIFRLFLLEKWGGYQPLVPPTTISGGGLLAPVPSFLHIYMGYCLRFWGLRISFGNISREWLPSYRTYSQFEGVFSACLCYVASRLQERRRLREKFTSYDQQSDVAHLERLTLMFRVSLLAGQTCEGRCLRGHHCPRGLCNHYKRLVKTGNWHYFSYERRQMTLLLR